MKTLDRRDINFLPGPVPAWSGQASEFDQVLLVTRFIARFSHWGSSTMPADFVDKNAAELPLQVRTVVRSATQTRALLGRGAPRRRLAKMMASGMMMVMMLTGTSTNCAQCYVVLSHALANCELVQRAAMPAELWVVRGQNPIRSSQLAASDPEKTAAALYWTLRSSTEHRPGNLDGI
jgi:hypothetical protein